MDERLWARLEAAMDWLAWRLLIGVFVALIAALVFGLGALLFALWARVVNL